MFGQENRQNNSMKITIFKFFKIGFISSLIVLSGCSEEKAGSPPETDTEQTEPETADLGETDSEETDPSKTVLGPLDVYYTVQTGPSSTAGTGRTPMKASAIHFFDTYIVVEAPESGGHVFPSNKIIDFDWRGGGRIEPTKDSEIASPEGVNIKDLFQHWVHSREEQKDLDPKEQIFRRATSRQFPPSRFRMAYKFSPNGECEWMFLDPADAHQFKPGKWEIDVTDGTLLKITADGKADSFRILELSKDLLRLVPAKPAP